MVEKLKGRYRCGRDALCEQIQVDGITSEFYIHKVIARGNYAVNIFYMVVHEWIQGVQVVQF
ncbi:UNVERIFIED_CONTAM: hypothetical protein ACS92_02875 [Bacillus cereus]